MTLAENDKNSSTPDKPTYNLLQVYVGTTT